MRIINFVSLFFACFSALVLAMDKEGENNIEEESSSGSSCGFDFLELFDEKIRGDITFLPSINNFKISKIPHQTTGFSDFLFVPQGVCILGNSLDNRIIFTIGTQPCRGLLLYQEDGTYFLGHLDARSFIKGKINEENLSYLVNVIEQRFNRNQQLNLVVNTRDCDFWDTYDNYGALTHQEILAHELNYIVCKIDFQIKVTIIFSSVQSENPVDQILEERSIGYDPKSNSIHKIHIINQDGDFDLDWEVLCSKIFAVFNCEVFSYSAVDASNLFSKPIMNSYEKLMAGFSALIFDLYRASNLIELENYPSRYSERVYQEVYKKALELLCDEQVSLLKDDIANGFIKLKLLPEWLASLIQEL